MDSSSLHEIWYNDTRKTSSRMVNDDYNEFFNPHATPAAEARHNNEPRSEWTRARKFLVFGWPKHRKTRTCPMMLGSNDEVIADAAAKRSE
eukprot:8001016-Pyramimonas_sp.AAC.1